MVRLIVVTGPPGAGKSTVARVLAGMFEPTSALVAGDAFFAFLHNGWIAPWEPEANAQNDVVVQAAAAATGRLVSGGYTTIYDGVIGPWFLSTFAAGAGLASVNYAILLPPEDSCVDRMRSRTGHEFTDVDAARHMYREFALADVADRYVFSRDESPEAIASDIVRRVNDGSLLWPK